MNAAPSALPPPAPVPFPSIVLAQLARHHRDLAMAREDITLANAYAALADAAEDKHRLELENAALRAELAKVRR